MSKHDQMTGEDVMKALRNSPVPAGLCALVALGTLAIALSKLMYRRPAGLAENAGRAIDETIHTAAEKLGKAAFELRWAAGGMGKNMGKDLDAVLTDAKAALDKATSQIRIALEKRTGQK